MLWEDLKVNWKNSYRSPMQGPYSKGEVFLVVSSTRHLIFFILKKHKRYLIIIIV